MLLLLPVLQKSLMGEEQSSRAERVFNPRDGRFRRGARSRPRRSRGPTALVAAGSACDQASLKGLEVSFLCANFAATTIEKDVEVYWYREEVVSGARDDKFKCTL